MSTSYTCPICGVMHDRSLACREEDVRAAMAAVTPAAQEDADYNEIIMIVRYVNRRRGR